MLSRENFYTITSFRKYREYKRHVSLKNSIAELLPKCIQFVDTEFYWLKVGFEKQEVIESPHRESLLNKIVPTVYPIFKYKGIGQADCLCSNENFCKISIEQCAYECYYNYTQLLSYMNQYLTFLCQNDNKMMTLYYNTEQKKIILKQIMVIIQKYLKFDCKDKNLLNDVSSQLNSINSAVAQSLIEVENCLFNEKKKFLQFSVKINNYIEIFHERIKRSSDLINEIQQALHISSLSFNIDIKQNEQSKSSDLEVEIQKVGQNFSLFIIQTQESKRALANLIQQYIRQKSKTIYKCLNCQRSFEHNKLLTHVALCQKKYEYDRLLEQNLNEILPKLLDLNGIIPTLQNLSKQKIRTKKMKHPQLILPINQKKSKFYSRRFSTTTSQILSKTNEFLEIGSDLEDQAQQTLSKLNPPKKMIQDLTDTELKDLIKIIEKISGIGENIKTARQSLNLLVYYKLRELKNSVFKMYKNLNVECPDAEILINLLLARYNYLQSAKKNSIKAKRSGINSNDEYLSLENVEIQGRYTEPQRQKKNQKKNNGECASQDDASSLSSQIFDERHTGVRQFQIIKKLGKGSFATVYLVRKKATEQKYAMKKIHIENYLEYYETSIMSENLKNQQCVFSITDNQFVMKAFYSFTEDQYHYFVMEYCPNSDFQELINKEKRLTEAQAKMYLAEIVEAVDYLHKKGIIHRDLKPQNIMLDANWHLKLTDYGLSDAGIRNKKNSFEKISEQLSKFALSSRKVKVILEKKRGIIGSPYYMAPEVIRGEPATFLSDWWSFGVIFFQMIVGIPPFLGRTRREIQESITKRKIWPSQISFGLGDDQISYNAKDLIDRLLTLDPKQRLGNDIKDIKQHQFFKGLDWDHLLQIIPPELECRYMNDKSEEDKLEEDFIKDKLNMNQIPIEIIQCFTHQESSSSNKSICRQLLIRRDLLNHTTIIKYKAREQILQKVRNFCLQLYEQCQRPQRVL